MKKFFIAINEFRMTPGMLRVLPTLSVFIFPDMFLETGVTSRAFGFEVGFLYWEYVFMVQEGY